MDVLVVADRNDPAALKTGKSEHWNLRFIETDYGSRSMLADIKHALKEKTDFMLFTRNDQVCPVPIGDLVKETRVGYSSVSALERNGWEEKTVECFKDFLSCSGNVDFTPRKRLASKTQGKTFSLVFDTEQFSCVKYGLPGILRLLERADVPATFFVTNIMAKAYTDLPEVLENAGHEIGIHGLAHEDLREVKDKANAMENMKSISQSVKGANFIGRMDGKVLDCFPELGISYFVVPVKNTRPIYAARSDPLLTKAGRGHVWMVPIAAETYNKPWSMVKRQLDLSLQSGSKHITVLMHPFADGRPSRLRMVEKVINYLTEHGLAPARLCDVVASRPKHQPRTGLEMDMFHEFKGRMKTARFLVYAYRRRQAIRSYHALARAGRGPFIEHVDWKLLRDF